MLGDMHPRKKTQMNDDLTEFCFLNVFSPAPLLGAKSCAYFPGILA
jgi:hypothetical protein